ncbi:MAG TPA: FxSxx-COOH system tetratricopeptide repeat protein [Streptosporangiaceae bacterium]|nr:FxSxx-COOH system tetratricopeptide repeat protein [Streptosporangiaceae bacterium]
MTEHPPLSVAGLLRQLRGEVKLTQEELAEAAGLSPRAISDLERGINHTARKTTALRLAGALGMTGPLSEMFVAAARGRGPASDVLTAFQSSRRQPGAPTLRLWNIPARNLAFTGRDDLLAAVGERLSAGHAAVVQALHGMGGVGKTQLAAEYAHRCAGSYDLAWWINAEQGGLIGDQIADLGEALACVPAGAGREAVRAAVLAELRERGRWLLVFDNAGAPADVAPWLPGDGGHVLITSREHGWDEIAAPVEIEVFTRAESIEMLRRRIPELPVADADRLADELGDLPLAIAQAAGFMADTGAGAPQYLNLLRTQAGELLGRAAPGSYPQSLAAATAVTAARLSGRDPAAAELADLCAFLAPEPIPEDLFTDAAGLLPGELAARTTEPLAWRETLAAMASQSLARVDHRGLQMHRLTQAILRDRLTRARASATRQRTEAILAASDPGDPTDPATWARWARLTPHVLAADLVATDNPALRDLARRVCWYLIERGDARTTGNVMGELRRQWGERLGHDHEHTLMATHYLAWALLELGRYEEARALNQDTWERRRRVLGEGHPDTLHSAHNLALVLRLLGDLRAARDLNEDTWKRHHQAQGPDHRSTLRTASILAADLRGLGEVAAARDLDRDTRQRRQRILGDDHPDTLNSAHNLAADLRELGEIAAARDLDRDTLQRRQRILGDDHPDTLKSARSLAAYLGETREP